MSSRIQMFLATLMVMIFVPMMMGASCQRSAVIDHVRDVHSGVVASFQAADTALTPVFEEAGNECISLAHEAGLSGSDARDNARECMESRGWFTIEEALAGSREALAELEEIYSDIEAGTDRYSDWQSVATRLLAHGRQIVRLLAAIGVDVPDELLSAIETICGMTNCSEE